MSKEDNWTPPHLPPTTQAPHRQTTCDAILAQRG